MSLGIGICLLFSSLLPITCNAACNTPNGVALLQIGLSARTKTSEVKLGACGVLPSKDECLADALCTWSVKNRVCNRHAAWLHVMKTGSSFGTTLAHYVNSSLPPTAHIPSGRNASDPEDTLEEGLQGEANFFQYKYPGRKWFKHALLRYESNPGRHDPIDETTYQEWKGALFAMFRDPTSRVVSAFRHFREGQGDLLDFAYKIRGQQASMLSLGKDALPRIRCEFNDKDCGPAEQHRPDVGLAIERLKGFAFIGLTTQYDLSVCLFHRMFGGECLPVEFMNMRPGRRMSSLDKEKLESLAATVEDPYDGPFYEAASTIFWENVRRFDVHRITCQETCAAAAHIFALPEEVDAESSNGRGSRLGGGAAAASTQAEEAAPEAALLEAQVAEYDWPGRYRFLDD